MRSLKATETAGAPDLSMTIFTPVPDKITEIAKYDATASYRVIKNLSTYTF